MDLLLKRNETTNFLGIRRYDLFAKLELEPEELAQVRKAQPEKTFIWEDEQSKNQGRWRLCLIPGAFLSLFFAGIIAFIFGAGILIIPLALLLWIPLTKLVFNQARSGITIADLITGRTIHSKTLDELYTKEHEISEKAKIYCANLQHMHSLGDERRISLRPE